MMNKKSLLVVATFAASISSAQCMQRLLRYAGAKPLVARGARFFCDGKDVSFTQEQLKKIAQDTKTLLFTHKNGYIGGMRGNGCSDYELLHETAVYHCEHHQETLRDSERVMRAISAIVKLEGREKKFPSIEQAGEIIKILKNDYSTATCEVDAWDNVERDYFEYLRFIQNPDAYNPDPYERDTEQSLKRLIKEHEDSLKCMQKNFEYAHQQGKFIDKKYVEGRMPYLRDQLCKKKRKLERFESKRRMCTELKQRFDEAHK